MKKTVLRTMFHASCFMLHVLCFTGCVSIYESVTQLYTDTFGSRSWARKAALGDGNIERIVERSYETGTMRGRFNGLKDCVQVIYRMPVPGAFNSVRCEAILPKEWNDEIIVLGCEGPGGASPKDAPQFAKNGAVVVCCDGGMNFMRNRDGSANPILSGIQRPEALETFMKEAIHLAVVGGKEIARAYYGRAVTKTAFYARETGAAQGVFLAGKYPEDIDEMRLVNPAIDFWTQLLYEFNVASHVRESTGYLTLTASQCQAVIKAAKEAAKMKKIDEGQFFELAAKYDSVFAFSYKSDKVRSMWHELCTAQVLSAAIGAQVPVVPMGVDMRPVLTTAPWRIHWFFGEKEYGHAVQVSKLLSMRERCAKLTPDGDLTAFAERGGKLEVVLEMNNPFVTKAVAEAGLKCLKGVKPTVTNVEKFSDF